MATAALHHATAATAYVFATFWNQNAVNQHQHAATPHHFAISAQPTATLATKIQKTATEFTENTPRNRCFEHGFCRIECGFHRFWTWVRRFLTLFSPVRVRVWRFRRIENVDIRCWFAVKWRWERWNALWNSWNHGWKPPQSTIATAAIEHIFATKRTWKRGIYTAK